VAVRFNVSVEPKLAKDQHSWLNNCEINRHPNSAFSIAERLRMKREMNDAGEGPQDQKRNRRNEETVRILIPSSVSVLTMNKLSIDTGRPIINEPQTILFLILFHRLLAQ